MMWKWMYFSQEKYAFFFFFWAKMIEFYLTEKVRITSISQSELANWKSPKSMHLHIYDKDWFLCMEYE